MDNQGENNIIMTKKKDFSSFIFLIVQIFVAGIFVTTWSIFIQPMEFLGYFFAVGVMLSLGLIGLVISIINLKKKISIFSSFFLIIFSLFSIFGFSLIEKLAMEFNGDADLLRQQELYIKELRLKHGFTEPLGE